MFILSTLARLAADHRARRRQHQTYLEISQLPNDIRKDIGWPDAYATPRTWARRS